MAKKKRYTRPGDRSRCRFCKARVKQVDYKDVNALRKLLTGQGKLFSKKRSGNCAPHQRSVSQAVKRARYMALLPYTGD
jgi:small subunit ribosomal protein S18